MSQTYTINSFQSNHVAQVDIANMESNHECHRSFFSGNSAPPNPVAGHPWFDTADQLPKIRNDGNNAWIAILTGTVSQKIWIYRNNTDDGWLIDSGVTDRVLAVKGGSAAYDVSGGNTAGESWTNLKSHTHSTPSHGHNHNHQWYDNRTATEHDSRWNSSGVADYYDDVGTQKTLAGRYYITRSSGTGDFPIPDSYTENDNTSGGSGNTGAQSTSDVRPAAAVGTLQYPDV